MSTTRLPAIKHPTPGCAHPIYAETWCSSCGASQGAGDEGVSSCGEHRVEACVGCLDEFNPADLIDGACVACDCIRARATQAADRAEAMENGDLQ